MSAGRKVVELGAMAILVVASLFVGKAVGSLVFEPERSPYIAPEAPAPETLPAHAASGEPATIELASRARPLMVFVLSVDCPFCRQNLPYWRELADQAAAAGAAGPELLILSMSDAQETATYLAENGLPDEFVVVTDEDIEPLDIPGVPATILFPSPSSPMRRWVGVLNDTQMKILRAWTAEITEKIALP